MWRGARAVLGVVFVSVATGCGAAVFECMTADDCVGGRAAGMCQPDGWCSFADGTCPSGQRYGDRAPSGIAGECVEVDLEASTSGTSNDTFASTTSGDSMTSTSASTTTTTDATSTTTTDATSSTTDPTEPMTTSDPVTTSPVSDSESDTMPEPVCGDGIANGAEECDGDDFAGLDCASFDFEAGVLFCNDDCVISTMSCINCEMGCPDTCSNPDDCSDAESCVIGQREMVGSCWPQCTDDGDCAQMFMGGECYLLDLGPACLLPCDVNEACPNGLECTPLTDMQLACL